MQKLKSTKHLYAKSNRKQQETDAKI